VIDESKNNLKLYLVVYSCEPNQGGEHEVGWKVANELANECNLTVITRKANQKLIKEFDNQNIDFIFLENETFIQMKPKGKFSYLYYIFWQLTVFNVLRKKVSKEDIVHYLTFGNIHLPHFLFLLKSKLVIGPMGGGSVIKASLIRNPSIYTKLKSAIYGFINYTVKINPIYYFLFLKCSKIILRTNETLNIIPKFFHEKCIVFLETGIDFVETQTVNKNRKLNEIVTTGRLIKSKNIDQVIEVFLKICEIKKESLKLTIVGDGPMRSFLEKKYSSIDNIVFLGKVPHKAVHEVLKKADLFLFCSIKEGGSHSLFEATMSNVPIACYNISGMQEFPKMDSAIKITPTKNIDNNIYSLAKKISDSFQSKEMINLLCENGKKDIQTNYSWKRLTEKYINIYKSII